MKNARDETFNAPDYDSQSEKNQLAFEKNEFAHITEESAMTVNSLSSDLNKAIEVNKPLETYHQPTQSELDHPQFPAGYVNIADENLLNSVGHLLRNARLSKKLSVEDVARQLRLSVPQIDAIEREDFEKLPGRTFLRGFIRNYANLVQLDPAPLLKMLPESARIISTHENTPFKNKQISFSSQRKNSKNNSLVIISIVFLVIAGIYFLSGDNFLNKEFSNQNVVSDVKIESKTAFVEIPLPLPAVTKNTTAIRVKQAAESENSGNDQANSLSASIESETPASIDNPVTQPAPTVQEPGNPVVPSGNKDHLVFKFTADSWIRVVDGSGSSLLEQLKIAGSEQTVTGKKPFSIVIGNASGVNLTYNDKTIDISTYKRQDGTARFKLE